MVNTEAQAREGPGIVVDRPFPAAARDALKDSQLRAKRRAAVAEVPDWEALRDAEYAIKRESLRRLDENLLTLEASVTAAGGTVHWVRDGAESNRIVGGHGAKEVLKIKSLTTDEIGLNGALQARGIAAVETDLAERSSCRRAATVPAASSSRRSTATAPRSAPSSSASCPAPTA